MIIKPAELGKPYSFSLPSNTKSLVGNLPKGLNVKDLVITGTPMEYGTKVLQIKTDEGEEDCFLTVVRSFEIKPAEDHAGFVKQLQEEVVKRKVWSVGIPSLTSQTLLELIGAVATYFDAKIEKAAANCFQDTAISDVAVRSIALMKGIRLSRKLPGSCVVTLRSSKDIVLPAYTQLSSGSVDLFNATDVKLRAGVSISARLYAGTVRSSLTKGLGTPHQSFIIPIKDFLVSDAHIKVSVDGEDWTRTQNGLWHLRGRKGFDDVTLADGRACVKFGTTVFGGSPTLGADVRITYATISKGKLSVGAPVAIPLPSITGIVVTELTGEVQEMPISAYKYMDTFGTFGSALTKSQIEATVRSYPGIVDVLVSKDPDLSVTYLPSREWDTAEKQTFTAHLDEVVAYGKLELKEAAPLEVKLRLSIAGSPETKAVQDAVENLFKPGVGFIGKAVYDTDIIAAVKAVDGVITLTGAKSSIPRADQYLLLAALEIEYEG